MTAIEQQSTRGLSVQAVRGLIAIGVLIALALAVAGVIFLSNQAAQANRSEEADLLAEFRQELAVANGAYEAKINPDRVIWQISAAGLAKGFDLQEVTGEVRAFQSDNARFQAMVKGRPDELRRKLASEGLGGSRQRRVIETFEASRNPRFATRAFLMRHELGEEVLIIADLLERRRGAWRMAGDQLVFATNVDRQLYERAVQRQQEIQKAISQLEVNAPAAGR